MAGDFEAVADVIQNRPVTSDPRILGVIAMPTDRQSSIQPAGVTPYIKALTLVTGLLAVWAGLCAI